MTGPVPPLDPSGSWVELLGAVSGRRVLLRDRTGSRAAALLAAAGAEVLDGSADGPVDDAVLAGGPVTVADLSVLRRRLGPGGRLLLVAGNPTSPLALLDRVTGAPRSPGSALRVLQAAARDAGFPGQHAFGVLRSVASPSTLFPLARPGAARVVLRSSNGQNGAVRRRLVHLLLAASGRGLAGGLVPAFAVLCGEAHLDAPVLGRIGPVGATEAKLLLDHPVTAVVKQYSNEDSCAAEAAALERVARARPDLVPRLLAREGATRLRLSWMPGRSLDLTALDAAGARFWAGEAARTLGRLHHDLAAVEGPDAGPDLVHGDFWLGNLIVDGRRVTGVVDWADSRPGTVADDLRFLVDTTAGHLRVPAAGVPALHRLVAAAYADGRAGGRVPGHVPA